MNILRLISDGLFKFEKMLAVILMSVMLLSIALGVICRYFLSSPLTWTDELAVYMLIWLTFVGGSMGIKTGKAASLDLVFDHLSLKWKRISLIVSYAFVALFVCILAIYALQWVMNPSVQTKLSPGLKISMFLPYMAIPFGAICMFVHSFCQFIAAFRYEEDTTFFEGGDC